MRMLRAKKVEMVAAAAACVLALGRGGLLAADAAPAAAGKPGGGDGSGASAGPASVAPPSEHEVLFRGRRIPSLVVSKKGTVLAFCSIGDNHPGNGVVRRSEDGGRTWGKTIAVTPADKRMQYASLSVVSDRQTGTIWCFYNKSTRRWDAETPPIWFTYSEDDGLTWKEPARPYDDTERFGKDLPPLRAVQGRGIHLKNGRLLANCYRIDKNPNEPIYKGLSYVGPSYLYSDDHGKTWRLSKPVPRRPYHLALEFATLELMDGTVYWNARGEGPGARLTALSRDGGVTWEARTPVGMKTGMEAGEFLGHAHSGLIRLTDERQHDRNRVLFSCDQPVPKGHGLRIWLSYDECKNWQKSKLAKEGHAGYSDLAVLPDMSVGCLYESNKPSWCSILFTRFTLEWLTDGEDKIDVTKFKKK